MAEKKITRKDLFVRIAEEMAHDAEVVEMCNKYIEQLSKPRERKANPEVETFRAAVLEMLQGAAGPMTNKEIAAEMAVSTQKSAAALRNLVERGAVIRTEGEKKSDPATFVAA